MKDRGERELADAPLPSLCRECEARHKGICSVLTATELQGKVDHMIKVPQTLPHLLPVLTTIPLQLLAYHIAVMRGADVDQPRNLAKSVTVE